MRTRRAQEIKTAVVSSSNNCAAVLEAAGIAQLFDTRVDEKDVSRLELKDKPAPDAFLEYDNAHTGASACDQIILDITTSGRQQPGGL